MGRMRNSHFPARAEQSIFSLRHKSEINLQPALLLSLHLYLCNLTMIYCSAQRGEQSSCAFYILEGAVSLSGISIEYNSQNNYPLH